MSNPSVHAQKRISQQNTSYTILRRTAPDGRSEPLEFLAISSATGKLFHTNQHQSLSCSQMNSPPDTVRISRGFASRCSGIRSYGSSPLIKRNVYEDGDWQKRGRFPPATRALLLYRRTSASPACAAGSPFAKSA